MPNVALYIFGIIAATLIGSTIAHGTFVLTEPTFGVMPITRQLMPLPVVDAWAAANLPAVSVSVLTVLIDAALARGMSRALRSGGLSAGAAIVIAQSTAGLALIGFSVLLNPDAYAYSIYGLLVGVHGINPYILPAHALKLSGDAALSDALALWGDPPPNDNYGPAWSLLVAAASRFAYGLPPAAISVVLMRVLALAATVAGTLALVQRGPPRRLAAFAFSPLVFLESFVNAHNDALMLAPALWAMVLLDDAWIVAALLLGLSIAVKYVTLLLLPFLAARVWFLRGIRTALVAGAVSIAASAICFVPFWSGPRVLRSIFERSNEIEFSLASLFGNALETFVRTPSIGSHHPSWPWLLNHAFIAGLLVVVVIQAVRFARHGIADPRPIWRTLIALLIAMPSVGSYILVWYTPMLLARGRYGMFARVLTGGGLASYLILPAFQANGVRSAVSAIVIVVVPLTIALLPYWQ